MPNNAARALLKFGGLEMLAGVAAETRYFHFPEPNFLSKIEVFLMQVSVTGTQ